MKSLIPFLAFLTILNISLPFSVARDNPGLRIVDNLQAYEHMLPHQKVYLHTDKDSYLAGERIWFKAYVVDVAQHRPAGRLTNLNIELVSLAGDYVDLSLLPLEQGLAYGDILLPDSMHEGNYILRAYTDLMRNFDSRYYFTKQITVRNPMEDRFISRGELRQNRRFNDELEERARDYQFAFFPEGGDLLEGIESRVAFKAANALGAGVSASGVVSDSHGREVARFETVHDGMGSFTLLPEPGVSYSALVRFGDGSEETHALPAPRQAGYTLSAGIRGNELWVRGQGRSMLTVVPSDISLLVHTRGRIQYFQEVDLANMAFETRIPLRELTDGVTHITLFEGKQAVAERLVFIHEQGTGEVVFSPTEEGLQLAFDTRTGAPGSYSVAIVEAFGQEDGLHEKNIASYLLLTSDLDGLIPDPAYYLSDNPKAREAADLLMMTHGWRRFEWEQIAARAFPELVYQEAEGLVVSGKIESLSRSHTFGGVEVRMTTASDGRRGYTTESDREGNFRFTGLHYENIFMASISIDSPVARRFYNIHLQGRGLDKLTFEPNVLSRPHMVLDRGDNWSRGGRPSYFVTAERRAQPAASRSYYGQPDQVVYTDELPGHYSSMHELLTRHVRGVTITGGEVMLRGPVSVQGSNRPVFIIDGNASDQGNFMALRPDEVDRIEVLSGSSAAILGVRGASGALIAYTKTTMGRTPGTEFAIRGYSTAAEFYRSFIDTEHFQAYQVPRTLWWEPNLLPGEDGKVEISLPERASFENSLIWIEGIDESGQITVGQFAL